MVKVDFIAIMAFFSPSGLLSRVGSKRGASAAQRLPLWGRTTLGTNIGCGAVFGGGGSGHIHQRSPAIVVQCVYVCSSADKKWHNLKVHVLVVTTAATLGCFALIISHVDLGTPLHH
jgi:hypothetical protein